jgi:glyoxalase family protein
MIKAMQLGGIHHLTAVTAQVSKNHAFYTQLLGMRLVKKTVNQDDVSAYHLFYADGEASPGSDLTFFDWPVPRERRGTRSITRTGLRVGSEKSLMWWIDRFKYADINVSEGFERASRFGVDFEDFEGQRLSLVVDSKSKGNPWSQSTVPSDHQILGLGPVTMSVPDLKPTKHMLTTIMGMREVSVYTQGDSPVHVFEMGPGGAAAELHVAIESKAPLARQGAGAVHHIAFRVASDEAYQGWLEHLAESGIPTSGPVDRFYFKSIYFREPGGILFEIATDGPGFAADESKDKLGLKLALPPFLEPRRVEIERGLKPL